MSARLRVAFSMSTEVRERIFPAERLAEFEQASDVVGYLTEFTSDAARAVLGQTDVLVTGWGSPAVDAAALEAAPDLCAILHSAGSVKPHVTDGVWTRGIQVSSAASANAVPVAEYSAAMIVLAGKKVLPIAARYQELRQEFDVEARYPGLGNYGKRIGIVSASKIGRKVIELLRPFGFEVFVYDPFLGAEGAKELGAELLDLDELLATSDVVSVHAPSLPETSNLIDARRIGLMPSGATLLNTARGEIIDQEALTARVVAGELFAILDVTTPWVLEREHPLYDHENVLLTPHIAGSVGAELNRLGQVTLDELRRLSAGLPLAHQVGAHELLHTA